MMNYDHILISHGELTLKGKNRKDFEQALLKNIKQQIKDVAPNVTYKNMYGKTILKLNGDDSEPIVERLKNVFGIQSIRLAHKVENDVNAIQRGALLALRHYAETNPVKTFKISAKRVDKKFPVESNKLNHYVGGYILKNTEKIKVDVHHPDLEIKIEVRHDGTYIQGGPIQGAGGLPVGTGGKALLMLSGGIDSPVAGYLTMKRGVRIEAVHFHSPPFTNERAKEKVITLTKILAKYCGDIRLHLVPFTEIQTAIHEKIPSNYSMTIMRRMMLRICERLAKETRALAIATGESIGQVASQTLESMHTINEVTNYPVIRPLVAMDKIEVINLAKKIGTYETSILPYEDCCTIFLPPKVKTKPRRKEANLYEQNFDYEPYIERALEQTQVMSLTPQEEENFSVDQLFE